MPRSLLLRSCTVLAAVTAVALPAAGCGSSSSAGGDPGADPAAFLPASSPVYVEAKLKPQGTLKANVDAVAGKLLQTSDPAQKITSMIDAQLRDQGATYHKDIEPWLGDRAGLAVLGVGGGSGHDADAVAAIASKDDARAQDFINGRKNTEKRSYRGVDYRYDAKDDTAAAVVDHAVVVGSERAFKSAVDAHKGSALSEAKNFKEARDRVSADGIGFAYIDPARFFSLALSAGAAAGAPGATGGQAQVLQGLLAGSGLRSIAASLEVAQDALRVDGAVIGMKVKPGAGDGPGAAAAVPDDSWLSVGVGDVGGTVQAALDQLGQSGGIGGIDPSLILQQLKSGLGVDVQRDFLSWMGDAALFVRGTSGATLNGALVVHSKDPAASQRSIGVLRDLLPKLGAKVSSLPGGHGLRVALGQSGHTAEIVARGDKFVIAVGPGARRAALSAGSPLGDTAAFKAAASLLGGGKPSLFLDTPQAVRLIGTLAKDPAKFAQAKPTLDAFGPAAAGVTPDGDVLRIKAAVSVK